MGGAAVSESITTLRRRVAQLRSAQRKNPTPERAKRIDDAVYEIERRTMVDFLHLI